MARNLIATIALAVGLAACGEKEETIGTSTTATATSQPGSGDFAIAGDWSGELTQKGLAPFLIAVRIADPSAGGTTRVAYTGIDCGGDWEPRTKGAGQPAVYEFTELISTGAGGDCKGSGTVTLTANADAPDQLAYSFSGGGVQSSGTLTRTDEAGIEPTFAQAGVPLAQ